MTDTIASLRTAFEMVDFRFRTEMLNLGFDESGIETHPFEQCEIITERDTFDRQMCTIGVWTGSDGGQVANIVRYADGRLFAEYDVLRPHPTRPEFFVEAMEIWGEEGSLKGEARLLPAL